jgi:hypothetical protein
MTKTDTIDGSVPSCDNPTCENDADYQVTVHYPQGDAEGFLCSQHSEGTVVTRNRTVRETDTTKEDN